MAEAEIGSPLWWLQKLYPRLQRQQSEIRRPVDYYEGRQPVAPFASAKYREEFSKMLLALCDNWMELVVDAVEERLHVEGFRMGDQPEGDKDAWEIWQRNELDADSELAHSTALTASRCALMVWADGDGEPAITVEHPSQVYVAYDAGSRRARLAAIKVWADEWSDDLLANVYLPDGIWKFAAKQEQVYVASATGATTSTLQLNGGIGPSWRVRTDGNGDTSLVNPLGVVPIVELVNRPKLVPPTAGRSEIAAVLSTQDQINKLVCDMIIASEYGAFRQRWATGIDIPKDPETGEDLAPFKAAADRVWANPSVDGKFGEFSQTDLSIYVKAIENRVQSLASRTRTPPHYLLGQSGSFPSGESLKATETGLIAKVHSRQRHFGERHEEVIRLAFAVKGDARAGEMSAETIWADPESRSEAEHTDSLLKKHALGVPLEQLWEDAGYSPQQIARFKVMLADEAVRAALANLGQPQPVAPVPPPVGEPPA